MIIEFNLKLIFMILILFNYEFFIQNSMSTEILCVECEEPIGEKINELEPLQIKCTDCIQTPGIFQEMGADPENKTDLFTRGFDTTESY